MVKLQSKKRLSNKNITIIFSTVFFLCLFTGIGIAFAAPIYATGTTYAPGHSLGSINNSTTYNQDVIFNASGNTATVSYIKQTARSAQTSYTSTTQSTGKVYAHIRNNNGNCNKSKTEDIISSNDTYSATATASLSSALATVNHTCHKTNNVCCSSTSITMVVWYGASYSE